MGGAGGCSRQPAIDYHRVCLSIRHLQQSTVGNTKESNRASDGHVDGASIAFAVRGLAAAAAGVAVVIAAATAAACHARSFQFLFFVSE